MIDISTISVAASAVIATVSTITAVNAGKAAKKCADTNRRIRKSIGKAIATDMLTGAMNHARFIRSAFRMSRKCAASKAPMSIICVGVRNLEAVNLKLGIASGDILLREIYSVMNTVVCEKNGIIGRFGGSDFFAAIYGCDESSAGEYAKMIVSGAAKNETVADIIAKTAVKNVRIAGGCATAYGVSIAPGEMLHAARNAMINASGGERKRRPYYFDGGVSWSGKLEEWDEVDGNYEWR